MTDLASLEPLARAVVEASARAGLTLSVAESCTGGLVTGALTEVPGSSAVLDRGFVTYSDAAKTEMLGVPAELIRRFGAVSRECALAMVAGALARSSADMAVSVTGIAGPSGGTPEKPVGLVHFGWMRRGRPAEHRVRTFPANGRDAIRHASVAEALAILAAMAG